MKRGRSDLNATDKGFENGKWCKVRKFIASFLRIRVDESLLFLGVSSSRLTYYNYYSRDDVSNNNYSTSVVKMFRDNNDMHQHA